MRCPPRVRRFKLSQDPAFAAKLRDVVGLYLDSPAHSLALSVDEGAGGSGARAIRVWPLIGA